jgi:hypothetical protein
MEPLMSPHDYRTEPEWFARHADRLERSSMAWLIGIGILTVLTLWLTS